MSTTEILSDHITSEEREVLGELLAAGPRRTGAAIRGMNDDRAVRTLEGAAALIARLQALQVHAVARLDRIRGHSRGALAEVELALSVTRRQARSLITVANSLTDRLPSTLGLMENGVLDWQRASKVAEATDWLSTEDAGAVDEVLASRLAGKNATQVRKSASHAAMKANPEGAENRAARRRASRRVVLVSRGEGTAGLSIDDAPVEKAIAAYTRIDREARALKTRDEPRTLEQLRADVALDLLLARGERDSGVRTEVFLYMDVNTYIGLNDDPAELAGHGHIPAELARYITSGPDTVLRRLITDPLTGQVLELGRTRYRPTAAVDEFVRVRDRECRGVGCSRPAQACDVDHHVDWDNGGPTNVADLVCYCKTEHKLKDEPGWHRVLRPDGALTIATPTGRSYLSSPAPLHEPRPQSGDAYDDEDDSDDYGDGRHDDESAPPWF